MAQEAGSKKRGPNPRALWRDLGVVAYERALEIQRAAGERAREREQAGEIFFLEHPPTITLGYSLRGDEGRSALRTSMQDLERSSIRLIEADRGGKATYHGPGQLVCYPVVNLKVLRLGVKRWVGKLLDLVVAALGDLGVEAGLDPEHPGVWIGGAKVAAVGIRVSDRISYHGIAINIDPDLAMFDHIVPCGIADRPVTSLHQLGRTDITRDLAIDSLVKRMSKDFKLEMIEARTDLTEELHDREAVS